LYSAIREGAKKEYQYKAKEKAMLDAQMEGIDLRKFGFTFNRATGHYDYDTPTYCVDLRDFGITKKFQETQNGITFYYEGTNNPRFRSVVSTNTYNFGGHGPKEGPTIGFTHNGQYMVAGMVFPSTAVGRKARDDYYRMLTSKVFEFYYQSYSSQFRR